MSSIFRPSENFKLKLKRYNFIHYSFKEKLFVPFLKIIEKILLKVMINHRKDIPNKPWNRNFYILWDAFEQSEKECWFKFKKISEMPEKLKQDHINDWDNKAEQHFYRFPKFLMRLWFTICLEDSYYRELTNFFLFRLQGLMNKAYKPEIKHVWPVYNCMFDSHPHYFQFWDHLNFERDFSYFEVNYLDEKT